MLRLDLYKKQSQFTHQGRSNAERLRRSGVRRPVYCSSLRCSLLVEVLDSKYFFDVSLTISTCHGYVNLQR